MPDLKVRCTSIKTIGKISYRIVLGLKTCSKWNQDNNHSMLTMIEAEKSRGTFNIMIAKEFKSIIASVRNRESKEVIKAQAVCWPIGSAIAGCSWFSSAASRGRMSGIQGQSSMLSGSRQ